MATKLETDRFVSPDEWYANSGRNSKGRGGPHGQNGSANIRRNMTGLPSMGVPTVRPKPLADAPGTYVRQR